MPFIDLPDRIPGLRAQARSDRPWYRITNQAADEAEVMLYDEVGGWLGATADEFINDLRGITAPKILLRVNSPGGSVTEGIAIANALRSHPANVTVQVDGVAASIASVIAMAGDHVRMMPNALLMVHEASGLCVGEAADMIKMAELLDKISDNIAGAYAARAGGSETEWRQVMKNETWYRGDEAVKAGLADEAVPVPQRGGEEPAEPEMRREFDLTAYGYHGPKRETPTPTPPPAAPQESATLTIPIASALGEQLVAALHASVAPPVVDTAAPSHGTAVEDGTWDKGANEGRLPSPMSVATAKKFYATYDETRIEDGKLPKDAAKLPHHFVSEDGTPGAASVAAVRNALARLPQTQGLSEQERSAAEAHLRKHLDKYNRQHGSDNHAPHGPENVAQQFQQGDRVRLTVPPHEEGQDIGTVKEINGNAYGVVFDGMEDMGVHRWYVDDELESAEDTPDRTPSEAPAGPDDAAPENAWADIVAHLTTPAPDPWAAAVAHLTTTASSSAATEAA